MGAGKQWRQLTGSTNPCLLTGPSQGCDDPIQEWKKEGVMKGTKAALALLIVARFMGLALSCYAQPSISQDKIPFNVPVNVRGKIEGLYSLDPLKRAQAAADLGLMGQGAAPAIPFLIGMFGDEALVVEDPPGTFRHLRYPVDTANTSPAAQAVKALVKIGKPAVEPLIARLTSEDWIVRGYAVAALGGIEDPRAVKPLITALKDENRVVRINIIIALGRIKSSPSVNPLIAALEDNEWLVRRHAARSLGELGDPRAIQPLVNALEGKGFHTAAAAAGALKKITGQDFGPDPEKWRKWWEENRGTFRKPR